MKEKLVGVLLLSTTVVTAQLSTANHTTVLSNDVAIEMPFSKFKSFEKGLSYANLTSAYNSSIFNKNLSKNIVAPFRVVDIAAYISKIDAEKSAALINKQKEIKIYCGGCDDKSVETKIVKDVKAEKVPGEDSYWHVLINDKEEDMAYVYSKTGDGRWRSVALAVGIKVEGVDMNKEVTEFIPNGDLK